MAGIYKLLQGTVEFKAVLFFLLTLVLVICRVYSSIVDSTQDVCSARFLSDGWMER